MDVEIKCRGCGKGLLVPSTYRGQVECPACHKVTEFRPVLTDQDESARDAADGTPAPSASEVTLPVPIPTFHMRTPEGQVYGPVERAELEDWVRQGRVSHDCEIHHGSEWSSAALWFPQLSSMPLAIASAKTEPVPSGFRAVIESEQYRFVLPHRGKLILTLAICGIVVWCPVLSIMAWVIGSADLPEIDAGRRDPEGRTLTLWGRNLGMVWGILWIVASGFGVLALLYLSGSYSP